MSRVFVLYIYKRNVYTLPSCLKQTAIFFNFGCSGNNKIVTLMKLVKMGLQRANDLQIGGISPLQISVSFS